MSNPDALVDDDVVDREKASSLESDFHHWYGLTQLWLVGHGLPQQRNPAGIAIDTALLSPLIALRVQDDRSAALISASVALAARNALVSICRARLSQAVFFLQRCLGDIRPEGDTSSVTTSISIADSLIGVLPTDQRSPLLLHFAHAHGLPRVLTEELRAFKARALTASSVPQTAFVSHLNTRLAFYGKFLRESALQVTEIDVAALWSSFVDGATSSEESEAFFGWLTDSRWNAESARSTLPDDAVVGVFVNLFCETKHFRAASAGIQAYKCFEAFFRLANATAGSLVNADDDDRWAVSFDAIILGGANASNASEDAAHASLSLVGLDILWGVATLASTAGVASAALDFLLALYTRIEQPVGGPGAEWDENGLLQRGAVLREKVWLGFVARCMAFLSAAATSQPTSSRGVVAVLRVLSRFLESVESIAPRADVDGNKFELDRGTLIVQPEGPAAPPPHGKLVGLVGFIREPDQKQPQRIHIHVRPALETVGMLRSRLADIFECPPRCFRLMHTNGEEGGALSADTWDNELLATAGLRVTFWGVVLTEPADDTRGHVYAPYEERIRRQVRPSLCML